MFLYCITCDKYVYTDNLLDEVLHWNNIHRIEDGCIHTDYVGCYGPFTCSEPPELPKEYLENVVCDMSPEEKAISNQNAYELLCEIVGA